MERPTVAVIGAGSMGEIFASGLLRAGWDQSELRLVVRREERVRDLEHITGIATSLEIPEAVIDREVVIVAVKPKDIPSVLAVLAPLVIPDQTVVSIAAGVPISVFEAALDGVPVVRAMPNTPSAVDLGMTAYTLGSHVNDKHAERARLVLAAVGQTLQLSEDLLDAVTAVSGTGPAYVFLLAESMIEAAIREGLPHHAAEKLVHQTLRGSGELLAASDKSAVPSARRGDVSRGYHGRGDARARGGWVPSLVEDAVQAAAGRSRDLGGERLGRMIRSAVLAVTDRTVTRKLITDTSAGKAVAGRFVAGDTLESAIAVAVDLNHAGMTVSLDHLGEHVLDIAEAQTAMAAYLACLDQIAEAGIDSNISIKLTQLGLGLDNDIAASHLDALAEAAASAGTTVTVDMEESDHTDATVEMYAAAQQRHGNLGIAIQSYLRRSAEDLDRLIPLGGHIRLCKGAYAEPDSIAYQGSEVDESYDRLGSLLMNSAGVKPAIATHDDDRLNRILELAPHRMHPWEFQMLYGVRRDRQAELVASGHQVRVYVPYGEAWYPYLTRRMAERPANMMFFARALVGS